MGSREKGDMVALTIDISGFQGGSELLIEEMKREKRKDERFGWGVESGFIF